MVYNYTTFALLGEVGTSPSKKERLLMHFKRFCFGISLVKCKTDKKDGKKVCGEEETKKINNIYEKT